MHIETYEPVSSCDGCGAHLEERDIAYSNNQGDDYCIKCTEAIMNDPESRGDADALEVYREYLKKRPEHIIATDFD